MSIFGSIVSKIFGHGGSAAAASPSPGTASAPQSAPAPQVSPASFNNPAPGGSSPGGSAPASQTSASAPASAGQTTQSKPVDVAAVLDGLASKNQQKLDWKHSIVDMLKLLGLDSSLQARQELAKELNYSGSTSDSAAMNIWLHKQVMQKLAENGGQVPAELRG
jgi:hypothetical protein